jgi:hypothetical protein
MDQITAGYLMTSSGFPIEKRFKILDITWILCRPYIGRKTLLENSHIWGKIRLFKPIFHHFFNQNHRFLTQF